VILGGAVCVSFATLVGLGLIGPGATGSPRSIVRPQQASVPAGATAPREPSGLGHANRSATERPAQDPQDRPGSPAARRAHRELASHRALQHVPYRRGRVSIALVGARAGKAVLLVRGSSLATDRRAWRAFLRRCEDTGRSYLPRFAVGEVSVGTPDPDGGPRR
jgi:hypothetical protein